VKRPLNCILVGINTRHTHISLALGCLQAFWERIPSRPGISRLDMDMNRGPEAILSELILLEPDVIGFSTYIWNLQFVINLSGSLKAAFPHIKVILGGPEVSFRSEDLLQSTPWIDLIIRGEGERTFEEVLSRLIENEPLQGVPGISFRLGDRIVSEKDRPLISPLDALPSPFRAEIYGRGRYFTYYEATRGCANRCTYCLSSVLGPVRAFSLDRVFADLLWFFQSDYSQVRFADRTFNQDSKRAGTILEFILRKNNRGLKFHFELNAEPLNDDLIGLFAQAPEGIFHLEIGVQTTHLPTLAAVNRMFDPERVVSNIRILREKTKCHLHLDLLAGLPGEDFTAFKKSVDDVFKMNPKTIQVGLVKLLRGTGLETNVMRGELFCSPVPPYAVVRSNWLSAADVVRIQDIGKLVEGIHNQGRFTQTLSFLSRIAFGDSVATMLNALALFWRKTERLFYQFGPETVFKGVGSFIIELKLSDDDRVFAESLILHEFRLTQKVPSGKSAQLPDFHVPGEKLAIKIAPGLRIFWYANDPIAEVSLRSFPGRATPVVYVYETDLSKHPATRALPLSLQQRLALAFIEKDVPVRQFEQIAHKLGHPPGTQEEWAKILDELAKMGFLLNMKPNVSNAKCTRAHFNF